ncbi:hypothetical protein E1H18_4940 [Caulobacter sp. RHG1]|nr:hypothetical protein [Caulobacter sp. RHG1]NQE64684.1 hypothetical protein [Caulobacter sp. RHG1]
MDPVFQSMLICLVFIASAFGVHWFFMRDYNRAKKRRD